MQKSMAEELENCIKRMNPAVFDSKKLKIGSISKLAGSGEIHHNNYLVTINGKKYIARFSLTAKLSWKREHLNREYKVLKAIEGLNMAPKAYYFERGTRFRQPFILINYIEGASIRRLNEKRLLEIARLAGKLHSYKFNRRRFGKGMVQRLGAFVFDSLGEKVERLVAVDGAYMIHDFSTDVSEAYLKIKRLGFGKERLCMTHGDFSTHNMVLERRGIVLIDFETFGIRAPEWDLAQFFHRNRIVKEKRRVFLSEYGKYIKPDMSQLSKFEKVRSFDRMLWAIWEAVMICERSKRRSKELLESRTPDRYLNYAKYAFRRCKTFGLFPKKVKFGVKIA